MTLSAELISQYQQLHQKHYGKPVSDEQVLTDGLLLIDHIKAGGLLINKYKDINRNYDGEKNQALVTGE